MATLLEEEIRRRIEKRLDIKLEKYPPELIAAAERVKKLASEVIGQMETDELPKVVVQGAFPPCIKRNLPICVNNPSSLSHWNVSL